MQVTFKNAPDILGQLYCLEQSETPGKNIKHYTKK